MALLRCKGSFVLATFFTYALAHYVFEGRVHHLDYAGRIVLEDAPLVVYLDGYPDLLARCSQPELDPQLGEYVAYARTELAWVG